VRRRRGRALILRRGARNLRRRMHTPFERSSPSRGQSATPIIVFFGIIVLSLIFFFAITLPRQLERKKEATAKAEASQGAAAEETSPAAPAAQPVEPSPVREEPGQFSSPRSLVQAVLSHLQANEIPAAVALLGDALTEPKAGYFTALFQEGKLRPATSLPLREIGDVADLYRWGIVLERGDAATLGQKSVTAPALPPMIELDVGRDPTRGWKVQAVYFSDSLRNFAHAAGAAAGPEISTAEADQNDPLRIAGRFLEAVLKQDYALARSVTDTEKVTREKVAGLCILFEEGGYRVADQRPLSATVAGAASAWVIVKVQSRETTESDFGIELQRATPTSWQVAGLNFSKLLASYMSGTGAVGNVAYTPIVKNPSGGESLVIYFDFDQAGLVPRAQRQLEIVANLLRDDPKRKLRLSGHADALGSDPYNRKLSSARAFATRKALTELGVSGEQIVTEGLGTLRPLDQNTKPDGTDNPEGRSRNRRTEILLDF